MYPASENAGHIILLRCIFIYFPVLLHIWGLLFRISLLLKINVLWLFRLNSFNPYVLIFCLLFSKGDESSLLAGLCLTSLIVLDFFHQNNLYAD